MNLNNSFLSVVLAVLGIFLTVVSLRLNTVVQSNSVCEQQTSLANANRGVLVLGIVLFMSSVGYLLCKRNCPAGLSVPLSTSDVMFLSFNLLLGIVIMGLFSIVSHELKKCNAVLHGTDSHLVNAGVAIGFVSTALSLLVLGKKLYDNREKASLRLSNALERAKNLVSESPLRSKSSVQYMDPFGYDDY